MSHLDTLEAQVRSTTSTIQSAITLINGLADRLREFANDPAKIKELADQLQESSAALADAIIANTPEA